MRTMLALGFGLTFEDLYRRDGLIRLDQAFTDRLKDRDPALFNRLMAGRAAPDEMAGKDESELLIDAASHLEDFIGTLFGIEGELAALQARHDALAPLYRVERLFVQRRAVKGVSAEQAAALDGPALAADLEALMGEPLTEATFATHVERWTADEAAHAAELDLALRYAQWATLSEAGRARHKAGLLFKVPHKLDPAHLVPVETVTIDGVAMQRLPETRWRRREGFGLTDPGMDLAHGL